MAWLGSPEPPVDDDLVDEVGDEVRCHTVRLLEVTWCVVVEVVIVVVDEFPLPIFTLPLPLLLAPLLE